MVVMAEPQESEVSMDAQRSVLRRKEVKYISMDALHGSRYNPPGRTDPGQISGLTKSIRDAGLQYPILVSKRADDYYEIIDGHRRWAVYCADHHEEMPCIVADGSSADLYAVVNGQTKPLSGKDWATVYISGGTLPLGPTRNNLIALSRLIGNEGIAKMAEAGFAPGVYQTARRVLRYVGINPDNDEAVLVRMIWWLIELRQTSNCLSMINNKLSAKVILEAFDHNTGINITR